MKVLLSLGCLLMVAASASHALAQDGDIPSQWTIDVRADQQESFGYDASVGYRLPVIASSLMPLLKIPGVYLKVGVGERLFTDSTASATGTVRAGSWHYGLDTRARLNEDFYLSSMVRQVHVKLPDPASQENADYLEVGLGLGLGAAKGMTIELGNAVRYMQDLEEPITVGSTVVESKVSLYPTLSVGYQL